MPRPSALPAYVVSMEALFTTAAADAPAKDVVRRTAMHGSPDTRWIDSLAASHGQKCLTFQQLWSVTGNACFMLRYLAAATTPKFRSVIDSDTLVLLGSSYLVYTVCRFVSSMHYVYDNDVLISTNMFVETLVSQNYIKHRAAMRRLYNAHHRIEDLREPSNHGSLVTFLLERTVVRQCMNVMSYDSSEWYDCTSVYPVLKGYESRISLLTSTEPAACPSVALIRAGWQTLSGRSFQKLQMRTKTARMT